MEKRRTSKSCDISESEVESHILPATVSESTNWSQLIIYEKY